MSGILASAWLALAVAGGSTETTEPAPERRTPLRVEPVLSLDSTIGFRAVTLEQGGEVQRDYSPLYKPLGLWLGADIYYRRGRHFGTGGLRGTFEGGVQLSTPIAGFPVGVAHSTAYEWKVRPRLSLSLGGRAAVFFDVPSGRYDHLELAVPVGLSTRRVDLVFSPGVTVPLGTRRTDVYGGELRRGVALMVMPFRLALRFKLGRDQSA